MWEISGFVRAAWSVLRMTEASETTKWSLEADNILYVCVQQCVLMRVCLSSEPSLFLCTYKCVCASLQCVCLCVFSLLRVSVCSITSETWQARMLIQSGGGVSESAKEPTGSKWYSLVLNARVGRPALLQPLVSCYIMTWRWQGNDRAPKRRERVREGQKEEEEMETRGGAECLLAGWGHCKALIHSLLCKASFFLCFFFLDQNLLSDNKSYLGVLYISFS